MVVRSPLEMKTDIWIRNYVLAFRLSPRLFFNPFKNWHKKGKKLARLRFKKTNTFPLTSVNALSCPLFWKLQVLIQSKKKVL